MNACDARCDGGFRCEARRGAPARVQRFALAFAQTGLLLGAPAEMECEMERARDTAARCRGPARSPESDAALRAR